jgi:hypothetical protein
MAAFKSWLEFVQSEDASPELWQRFGRSIRHPVLSGIATAFANADSFRMSAQQMQQYGVTPENIDDIEKQWQAFKAQPR